MIPFSTKYGILFLVSLHYNVKQVKERVWIINIIIIDQDWIEGSTAQGRQDPDPPGQPGPPESHHQGHPGALEGPRPGHPTEAGEQLRQGGQAGPHPPGVQPPQGLLVPDRDLPPIILLAEEGAEGGDVPLSTTA